ncbi:MAG: hypothetical protein L6R42_010128 [Xanthoria sp. 1 TBL-2021]|nr:MAG: hypothetical protein L6R42_010128 [Xanthoria sp. 1 TBL-2021]
MVFRLSLAAVAATFALSVVAMPTSLHSLTTSLFPRGGEGEPFECPDPSSTARAKQALIDYGAQSVDIAIAMLENGCAFHAAYPAGNNKPDDAAELGVYRNNWHMIREYCDHFQGAGPSEWQSRGQELHDDVGLATQCQRQLFSKLGADKFFGLQRGGLSNQGAGAEYGQFVGKYQGFCKSHMKDGMAIYWNVASM